LIEASHERPRIAYQISASFEASHERPRTAYRISASLEASHEKPRTVYRFSASLEASHERPRMGNRFSVSLEAPRVQPRTRCRFSASTQGRLGKTTPSPPPRPTSRTKCHVRSVRSTAPAMSAERRLDTAEWPTRRKSHRNHAVRDRTGQGLPAAVLGTVPMTGAHTTLCYLTPAPETTRRAESSPGYYSLGISVQNQLLPPRLDSLLQGLGNLGIHAYRAPYDGSASAPTGPRLFMQSTHSNQHVARQAMRLAITGASTSHKVRM